MLDLSLCVPICLGALVEKGTRRSVWTAGVRKAVRKGAGQFVVKSTREKTTKRWRELHFERGCQERKCLTYDGLSHG